MNTKTHLSPQEVAEKLPISLWSVYQHLQKGTIKGVKLGSKWAIPFGEITRILTEGIPQKSKTA